MSMLNFKNHRLLEEIRDNTSKTVLEHNGELQVIAQDELLLIKNELADIKQTLADGTQKVQLSGTIAGSFDIIPRGIHNKNVLKHIKLPLDCKGLYVEARVFAVTGTNPVCRFVTSPGIIVGPGQNVQLVDELNTGSAQRAHVFGPGFVKGDASSAPGASFKVSGVFIPNGGTYRVDLAFTGDFAEGEGFDMRIVGSAFTGGEVVVS